jgi:hemoglobin/transferrin/lactoferrin receptor protein
VIHYYTRDPQLAEDKNRNLGGGAYIQHSTANIGKVGHLNFNIGGKKLGSLTSITFKDLGNIRIGSTRNLFMVTGGKQNIMQSLKRMEPIACM